MLTINHVPHLPGINKECFSLLFFTFCNKPQCNRNCYAVKKLSRHRNNSLNQIVLYNFFTYFSFTTGLRRKCTVSQNKTNFPIWCKMMNHMLNPCIVGIISRWKSIFPTFILCQFFSSPWMIVEWRIR